MKLKYQLTFAVLLGMMFATLLILMQRPLEAYGSVNVANEYLATSTGSTSFANYRVIQGPSGIGALSPAGTRVATSAVTALGSVTITNTGAKFCLYDATSTATNGEWATTTIACFKASAPEGTYTFDAEFKKGILLEQQSSPTVSSWASTTIMYR